MHSKWDRAIAMLLFLFSLIIHSLLAQVSINYEGCLTATASNSQINITCTLLPGFPAQIPLVTTANTVSYFTLNNNQFSMIPANAFANYSITSLIFSSNSLQIISASAFSSINSLTNLTFSETSLFSIAPAAFSPIAGLASLNFNGCSISNVRLLILSPSFASLTSLTNLNMDFNYLINIDAGVLSSLTSLQTLSVRSNILLGVSINAFTYNTKLQSLDLTSNSLTDLATLLSALSYAQSSLITLNLAFNKFDTITSFPSFPNLKYIDLSNNLLFAISTTPFSLLANLAALNLANNSLNTLPSIRSQNSLLRLDMSNQNGQLTALSGSVLARSLIPSFGLALDLRANSIGSFDKQVFCSVNKQTPFVSSIAVSYSSMQRLSICNLQQLYINSIQKVTITVEPVAGQTAYTDICNCNYKVFAANYNVIIAGVCGSFNDTCANTTFINSCGSDYNCIAFSLGFLFKNNLALVIFTCLFSFYLIFY